MPRNTQKKKAGIIKALWEKSDTGHRKKWRGDSQRGYDFYLGEQISGDDLRKLEEAGMPSFIINRVTPIIEIMKYFVTANNPRWKAVGVEGSDSEIAQIHSDIADYCWRLSDGKSLYGQIILDSMTRGVGYFKVDIDKNGDQGRGEVVFGSINPYDVFVDPMSRDFLFRDAAYIIVKKSLSKSQLKLMLPEYKTKIQKASTQAYIERYSERDVEMSDTVQPEDISEAYVADTAEEDMIVPYFECYQRVKVPFVNYLMRVPPNDAQLQEIVEAADVQVKELQAELEVQLKEKLKALDMAVQSGEMIPERAALEMKKMEEDAARQVETVREEFVSKAVDQATKQERATITKDEFEVLAKNKDFAEFLVDWAEFQQDRIKVSCSVGDDVFLYEYLLNTKWYPIVPIPYLYSGTPYPMSAVMPMVGKQQEINKAHQIMLHNANLASNLRWLYEEGSVPEEEWEQYSSAPGALLKYRQGFQTPTPVLPAPINNAFYTVVQEGKSDMEYIAGIPSAMMGFVQEQTETYRGLLANDEFGTRRIRAWMNSIVEPCLEHLGKVFKDFAQFLYKEDKVFRIVEPMAGQQEVEERTTRINEPIYNSYGEAIGRWKDYASQQFDVAIVAGATMPVSRWALIDEYFKWYQAGLIDDIAMIAETDIRNKEKIVERKSMLSQAKGQLEQLQETIKDKDGTIETLERQLIQAGIRQKIDVANKEVTKGTLETKAQQKFYQRIMQEDAKKAKEAQKEKVKSSK